MENLNRRIKLVGHSLGDVLHSQIDPDNGKQNIFLEVRLNQQDVYYTIWKGVVNKIQDETEKCARSYWQ